MGRGQERSPGKALRQRFPLAGERQALPRFDGAYVGSAVLVFSEDRTVTVDGESGTWLVEHELLRVAAGSLQAEGYIGVDGVYLVGGGSELELAFEPVARA